MTIVWAVPGGAFTAFTHEKRKQPKQRKTKLFAASFEFGAPDSMVKRRRIAHKPKQQEVKEEKSEQPEPPPREETPEPDPDDLAEAAAAVQQLLASPVAAPPPQPMVPLAPTTAQLQVARTRLSGLLHRVAKAPGAAAEDSDSSQDDIPLAQALARAISPPEGSGKRGSPAPVAKVKSEGGSSTPTGKQGKRRRRREATSDSAFHHTYVMKLFDRSVDLAQFSETTSLYPVCRAWMANQPRNPNLMPKRRSASLSEDDDDEKSDKDDDSNKDSGDEETIKPVYKMPPPEPLPDLTCPMRVPSPIPRKEADGGKDENSLLAGHVSHWRAVKTKWMQAGHANEQRFQDSISIIEEIYKKAQEMYA
ncbi:hypothetical protein B566_EDAN003505 [Ephemera danica]|nr:hypothetical protein B566_EDAN003505 [Ephemera danica]